jgi:chromosome segregation ATPase
MPHPDIHFVESQYHLSSIQNFQWLYLPYGLFSIDSLTSDINNLKTAIQAKQEALIQQKKDLQDIIAVKESLNRLNRQIENSLSQFKEILSKFNVDINTIFNVQYKQETLDGLITTVANSVSQLNTELNDETQGLTVKLSKASLALSEAQKKLSEPELKYREYLKQKQAWEKQIEEITGTAEKEGSIKYYQAEIEYVEHRLQQDLSSLKADRHSAIVQLMRKKSEVLTTYNKLFAPVVDFITKYSSELNDYPIEFDAAFSMRKFTEHFFDYVGQQVSGSFYGKEAGITRLNESIESIDMSNIDSIVAFPNTSIAIYSSIDVMLHVQ